MTKKKVHKLDLEQVNRHLSSYIDDLLEKNKSMRAEIVLLQEQYDDLYFKYEGLLEENISLKKHKK